MQDLFVTLSKAIELPDAVVYGVADASWAVFGPAVSVFDQQVTAIAPDLVRLANNYTATHLHPISKRLPLLTPTHVAFCVVMYLVVILALYPIGKAVGKLQLKSFSMVHNAFLFAVSLYMWGGILITAVANGFTLWNNPVGTGDGAWRMAKILWLFYVSKLPEFLDTVIMMLKHNYRQVSFLHLYHHGTIFVVWFIVFLEGPGGDAYFSGMLNSGVHVVMYGYYLGTSLFPTGKIRSFLNSIKFFITYGQMAQFATNCVQSAYLLLIVDKPRYPRHLIILLLVYMFTLLGLFGNFLIQNQFKARRDAKIDKKKKQ
jgi:elongation of very long chain fatty acids protein 4